MPRREHPGTRIRGFNSSSPKKNNTAEDARCCDPALAVVYTRFGRKEEAIRSLEQAFNDHVPYLIWDLPTSPDLDPLRSDHRFADLLARLLNPSQ
jgi:hypothetical protein